MLRHERPAANRAEGGQLNMQRFLQRNLMQIRQRLLPLLKVQAVDRPGARW
jgi:hypothetical protein